MGKPKIDKEVVEILAKRFVLTFEQATNLYLVYFLAGCCEEAVDAAYQMDEKVMFGIGKGVIRQVLLALHDLYNNPEYREGPQEG